MNPQQHDKSFLTTFTVILGFLGAFTFTISILARAISAPEAADADALARIEERIRPVGQVVTDPARLLAMAPAAAARAPMSGAEIVTKVCGACHGSGVLNAPKIGDKGAWGKLKSQGIKALEATAIKGKGQNMPARGGDASLSDAEVKAAIEEMLKQTGV